MRVIFVTGATVCINLHFCVFLFFLLHLKAWGFVRHHGVSSPSVSTSRLAPSLLDKCFKSDHISVFSCNLLFFLKISSQNFAFPSDKLCKIKRILFLQNILLYSYTTNTKKLSCCFKI